MSRFYDTLPSPDVIQKELDLATLDGKSDEVKVLRHLLSAARCKATLAAEAKAHAFKAEAEARRTAPYYPGR